MPDVELMDPFEIMQQQARADKGMAQRRRSERVSYWKRPTRMVDGRPANMPGWVFTGDTQPGKFTDYVVRGCRPLHQFGRVWDGEDEDGRLFKRYGPWGPILSKPGGPEQFPLDQVTTFRWFDPNLIGGPFPQYEPMRWVRFPQLHEAVKNGLTLHKYNCPDCAAVDFLQPVLLARHLRNSHNWDRVDLISWGELMGVDFRREFAPRAVEIVALPDVEPAPLVEPDASVVPIETAVVPTLAQVREQAEAAQKPCHFCNMAKAGICKRHARKAG